jgi:hypothetical protein
MAGLYLDVAVLNLTQWRAVFIKQRELILGVIGQLQKALNAAGRMVWALAVVPMRKQHRDPGLSEPLGFAGDHILERKHKTHEGSRVRDECIRKHPDD